jgi:hypothetical protein
MPLLSPAVLIMTIEVFKGIGEGVMDVHINNSYMKMCALTCMIQVLSWIYPFIWYIILCPSADIPKDASSLFFFMVRENLDREWMNPARFIDEVCDIAP